MEPFATVEAVVGGLLVFALPGLFVARAIFPEWRFRGPGGRRRALETATLAFVLSVGLTVLVGAALLGLAPGGFAATWSDPLLEAILAAIAAVAAVAAYAQGAFARVPPAAGRESGPGEEHAWGLARQLDRLRREERALARRGASLSSADPGASEIAREREEVARRIRALELAREEEYAR